MLQDEHDIVQFPHLDLRPGMLNENEELERFKERHALPGHWRGITFILVQKSLADSDQAFEASQPGGIIQQFCIDLDIVEIDREIVQVELVQIGHPARRVHHQLRADGDRRAIAAFLRPRSA